MNKPLTLCLVVLWISTKAQFTISPFVNGQNANLTATVGLLTNAGGKFDEYSTPTGTAASQNHVGTSHATIVRYGGQLLEENAQLNGLMTNTASNIYRMVNDYVEKATAIFANGMEPALTLPIHPAWDEDATTPKDTLFSTIGGFCATFVQEVNNRLQATLGKVCRYWIYSNEPQLAGGPHNYVNADAPKRIFRYISSMHSAAMSVWQSTWTATNSGTLPAVPQFIGPELAGLDNYNHGNGLNRLTEQLLGVWSPGGGGTNTAVDTMYSIRRMITHFSWHDYPFNDQARPDPNFPAPTRQNVINRIANPVLVIAATFSTSTLAAQIASVQGWLGTGSPIKMGITEYNITHKNRVLDNINTPTISAFDPTYYNSDSTHRQGANSFLAAQFYAEYISYVIQSGNVEMVNFWSGLEGTNSATSIPNYMTNVGYLNSDPSKFGGVGAKKPSYHAFKMMGYLRGELYRGTAKSFSQYDTTGIFAQYQNGVKTFGAAEPAGIRIIVINHTDSSFDYHVNFSPSGGNVTGRATLNFTAMASAPSLTASIGTFTYNGADTIPARSIVMLQFDCHGNFMTQRNYTQWMARANPPMEPALRVIGPVVLNYGVLDCDHPGGISGTFGSDTYSKDTLYIKEDITVAPGQNLTLDSCLVVMSPGTKITTTEGTAVHIKNSVLVGCGQSDWIGIQMSGFNLPNESLKLENSFIVGAATGVQLYKIPKVLIKQTTFVGRSHAVVMDACSSFTITQNLMVCMDEAAISTKNTTSRKNFITMNQMWDVYEGFHSENDLLDSLTYGCNDHKFYNNAVYTFNSTVADQGDPSGITSAGNNFYNMNTTEPTNYWTSVGGNTPTYFWGPMSFVEFSYFTPMTINTASAMVDPLCSMLFSNDCPDFQIPLSVKKNGEQLQLEMTVYPNPSNGDFTLEIKDSQEKYQMSIYDIMGRLLESREIDFSRESSVKFEIKMRGMYIVNLSNEKNRITKKVIVN